MVFTDIEIIDDFRNNGKNQILLFSKDNIRNIYSSILLGIMEDSQIGEYKTKAIITGLSDSELEIIANGITEYLVNKKKGG